jgi:hypothetical protein
MQNGIFYNRPEKYKHSIAFTSRVNPIVSADIDKYISIASQSQFKKYLPKDINFDEKVDFLGVCGEAFIVNKLNANDDGIKTSEGLRVADLFPFSFIDANHNRKNIIGVVVTASFAEFGTGKELTREEASKMTSPFSVILSGIVWKAANPKLAEVIETSSDPSSDWFNKIFFSWELAFEDFELIKIDANKTNLEDGEFVTDPEQISKLEKKLRSYGGKGVDDKGKKIGRIPIGDVIPLGLGIVEDPAGQVQPIITQSQVLQASNNKEDIEKDNNMSKEIVDKLTAIDESFKLTSNKIIDILIAKKCKAGECPECGQEMEMEDPTEDDTEVECAKCKTKSAAKKWMPFWNKEKKGKGKDKEQKEEAKAENTENNAHFISQSNKEVVKENRNNKNFMKITKFDDLNDENIKECLASDLKELFKSKITEISQDWETKTKEQETAAKAAKESALDFENKYKELETKYKEIEVKHNTLASEIVEKQKVERFSARMSTLADKYDLNEKQSNLVAEEIKLLDKDEEFNKYMEKAELFFAKKEAKAAKTEIVASTTTPEVDTQKAVDDALKAAKANATAAVPNASDSTTQSLADKSKGAFGLDGWEVISRKRK